MKLGQFVSDFADAMRAVDAMRPIAQSARGDKSYQPGIGPVPTCDVTHSTLT